MNAEKNKLERVEMMLRETFRRQAVPGVPEDWVPDVMRSIRRVAAQASGVKPRRVEYIVWRAVWATAAAAMIVVAADLALMPSISEVGWQAHETGVVLE